MRLASRGAVFGSVVFVAALAGCDTNEPPVFAPDAAAPVSTSTPTVPAPTKSLAEVGREHYDRYCDFCHGAAGEGYLADAAPSLANPEFLAIASDAFLTNAIARGRPGTVMSAWGKERGGPLDEAGVAAVVAYLRSWAKKPFASVDARPVGAGDVARGAAAYAASCKECHGDEGKGARVLSVSNPEFLANASDGFLLTTLERGRPPTGMGSYETLLDAQTRLDLVALLRSWQKPVDGFVPPLPPAPGALESVVLNPGGPEPAFDPSLDVIPADVIKAELDRGASFVVADARAPSDYVALHFRGAVSVPFYQVNDYAKEIPKERYVITYCACPHAISGQARDAFRALGYRSSVLDEGILVWRDRGYPVRGGARP